MKRIAIFAGLAFAIASPAFAQQTPTTPPTPQEEADAAKARQDAQLRTTGHSTTVYHGPHQYPAVERGKRAGDPPVIDHRADTLIVEPTVTTVTIMPPP